MFVRITKVRTPKEEKRVISKEMLDKRKSKREAFKPTDNLSPSETAAVVSKWTHNAFTDSWKDEVEDGEVFHGEIKDTFAPMEVYVDKKNKSLSVYYLSLNDDDIKSYVQVGLKSGKEPDEAFVEDINNALSEDFSNEHAMAYKDVNMPLTQIELEKLLDSCEEEALQDYNKLEKSFYEAVDSVQESGDINKKNLRKETVSSDKAELKKIRNRIIRDKNIQEIQKHIYKDDGAWGPFRNLISLVKGIEGVTGVYYKDSDRYPQGYRWDRTLSKMPLAKERDIEIETDFGTLKGCIICSGAGSVEDPLEAYDMILNMYPL